MAPRATFPTLLVLAAGKLAMVLGGTGQGPPTTGEPATAYLGPGPWGSLGPAIPAIPAQALEAIVDGGSCWSSCSSLAGARPLRRPDGRLFFMAVAGWAVGRAIVASTWRDPIVVGPLRAEQVIAIVVAARCARAGGRPDRSLAPAAVDDPACQRQRREPPRA